jgi:protein-S-isoprenylcysteine O-methyltransferase Ste14
MSLILLIGLLGIFLVLLFKNPIIGLIGENNNLIIKLRNAKWFQNPWFSGVFLFVINAFLFFLTVLVLYVLMYFFIPFVHLIVMFIAVIGSIFTWIIINRAWQGTKRNRLKMGAIGSGFYLFLTLIFVYRLVTLKPSYPGDDTFMGAIGLFFSIIVTVVAFVTCLFITGFTRKNLL